MSSHHMPVLPRGEGSLRVAVITPCWRESPEVLAKCMASVRAQTHPVTHILVSDGSSIAPPTHPDLIHIALPFNIGNSGGTPRGLGAQLAFNMGFDAVAFLDADNWYEPDHIAHAVQALQQPHVAAVFARRRIIFPDGEIMTAQDPSDESGQHVDTNCYIISRRAAYLMTIWLMWPKEFGVGEDRMMRVMIEKMGLQTVPLMQPTVWYQTNWPLHYRLQGKQPVAPMRAPLRAVNTHFDEATFCQLTGLVVPAEPLPMPQRIDATSKVGLIVVDWRMRPAEGAMDAALSDLDLYILPDDIPHPCDRATVSNVHGLKLPRHRGYTGTAAGLGAALAFMEGCDRVVVFQGDWTFAQHGLAELYQRCRGLEGPFHAESIVLASGETAYVTVFDRAHAHLGLLPAQMLMAWDAEARFNCLTGIARWCASGKSEAQRPAAWLRQMPEAQWRSLWQCMGPRLARLKPIPKTVARDAA